MNVGAQGSSQWRRRVCWLLVLGRGPQIILNSLLFMAGKCLLWKKRLQKKEQVFVLPFFVGRERGQGARSYGEGGAIMLCGPGQAHTLEFAAVLPFRYWWLQKQSIAQNSAGFLIRVFSEFY